MSATIVLETENKYVCPIMEKMSTLRVSTQDHKQDDTSLISSESRTYTITVHIGNVSGLRPVYPLSELVLTAAFGEEVLFASEKMLIAETLSVDHDLVLTLNIDDFGQVNKYLSTPIQFTLTEYETLVEDEQEIVHSGRVGKLLWTSEESVLDLEEALFGTKTDLQTKGSTSPKKSLSKKSKSKGSRSSAGSKKGKGKSKGELKEMQDLAPMKPAGPQVAGSASIDMVPLFLGTNEICDSLVLKAPAGQPLDDRIRAAKLLPKIQIDIAVDKALPSGNIFYYTLESIYNLPKIMSKHMTYQIVIGIPTNSKDRLIPFNTVTYAETPRERLTYKKYYGSEGVSNYALCDDFGNVKSQLPVDNLSEAILYDIPRLQYNIVKGEYAFDDDIEAFRTKITKHRCLGLEVYMTNPAVMSGSSRSVNKPSASNKDDRKGIKGSKFSSKAGSKKGKDTVKSEQPPEEEYLHLMAFADVCRLLCPGEQTTRVACELRTFNLEEFEQTCGLQDSFFRPKPPPPPPPPEIKEGKPAKAKGGKKEKASKSSKSSKGSKAAGKKVKGQGDLKAKLPAPPAVPPPSKPVYNEQGFPTFIIVEFEFREPLIPKRNVEDLHSELEEIMQAYPVKASEPREFKSKYVSRDIFQNSIRTVAADIKVQYRQYLDKSGKKENLQDFLEFIQTHDQYQTYLTTLTKSAAMYCNVAKLYDPKWSMDEYHAFIGESYVDLVEMMNEALTAIGLAGGDTAPGEPDSNDDMLFYAKEATEIGAIGLATRYYLQRIASDEVNASFWLDYAVFKLQINEPEAAQECLVEALKYDPGHRDCLLLFACLLARKGNFGEAETCLLNVTLCHPRWLEGWMALYCIYHRNKNIEGMELCLEISQKYNDEQERITFMDLHWRNGELPHKYTFMAITYFIQKRLFDEAEIIIADELFRRQTDTIEYLLAVIDSCKGHQEHALDHIDASFKLGSCSLHKFALRGHIYALLNRHDCAVAEFENIIKSASDKIPFDASTYMDYIRAGLSYSALGMDQEARKVFLMASEKHGTPYSWLATGVLYYYQHDYLSAEECLAISNTLDNVMPETWAYLTLVNIQLDRPNEASNCYQQAIDHQLQNHELLLVIEDQLKTLENELAHKLKQKCL